MVNKKSGIGVRVEALVFETKTGKFVRKYPSLIANTLLKQFITEIFKHMAQYPGVHKTITGAEITSVLGATDLRVNAGDGIGYGVVIGSDTTPVDFEDYKLGSIYSTSIFSYGGNSLYYSGVGDITHEINIQRTFNNISSSDQNIEEVGLYSLDSGGGTICLDRTLYHVTVNAGNSVIITYKIYTTWWG